MSTATPQPVFTRNQIIDGLRQLYADAVAMRKQHEPYFVGWPYLVRCIDILDAHGLEPRPDVPRKDDPITEDLTHAANMLRYHGYAVTAPDMAASELTPGQLCARFNLSYAALHKRLNHPLCPASIRRRSETGRLLTLGITEELAAFLSQPKQPGKRLDAPQS